MCAFRCRQWYSKSVLVKFLGLLEIWTKWKKALSWQRHQRHSRRDATARSVAAPHYRDTELGLLLITVLVTEPAERVSRAFVSKLPEKALLMAYTLSSDSVYSADRSFCWFYHSTLSFTFHFLFLDVYISHWRDTECHGFFILYLKCKSMLTLFLV